MRTANRKSIDLPQTHRAPRRDLSRRPGESDTDYRERILDVIGAMDNFAREAAHRMFGACLDWFAGSVSHAEFIGWRGAAGRPTEYHANDCRCPPRIRAQIREQQGRANEARATISDAEALILAAEAEVRRLESLLVHGDSNGLALCGADAPAGVPGECPVCLDIQHGRAQRQS